MSYPKTAEQINASQCGVLRIESQQYCTANTSREHELEEALRALLERYVGLVNSGDAGNWNPETEAVVIEARKLLGV